MSKESDRQQQALYTQLLNQITAMNNPKSNPAQDYLTNQAIAGSDVIQKGEFNSLPKGMFFDFQMPQKDIEQYKKLSNVNQGGTFALANSGNGAARSQATALQGKYLQDRFARDAGQNYQNNISDAAGNVRNALGQAAGASAQNQSAVAGALNNLYGNMPKKNPNAPGMGGQILGIAGGILSHI